MSKSKQPESKAPIRHTVRPGVSSPIFLQTVSGATCHLRRVDDVDPTRSLKLFADDEGIICFHVRPSVEAEVIAKFVIECEADAKISHYPLELRGSRKDTPEMPFPDKERPPRKERQSVRPALSREEGLRLSDKELLDRGYPPRPDPKAVAPFRTWLKAISTPATIVKPRIVTNTGVSHRHVHRVGSVASNWSGFELRGGPFSSISGGWNVPPIVFGETGLVTQSAFWVGLMAMARMIWFRQALNKITSFIIFLDNICRSRITMHGRNFYPNNLTSRSSPTYRLIPETE